MLPARGRLKGRQVQAEKGAVAGRLAWGLEGEVERAPERMPAGLVPLVWAEGRLAEALGWVREARRSLLEQPGVAFDRCTIPTAGRTMPRVATRTS